MLNHCIQRLLHSLQYHSITSTILGTMPLFTTVVACARNLACLPFPCRLQGSPWFGVGLSYLPLSCRLKSAAIGGSIQSLHFLSINYMASGKVSGFCLVTSWMVGGFKLHTNTASCHVSLRLWHCMAALWNAAT